MKTYFNLKEDEKILNKAQEELSLIAGQKAIITSAKKAIKSLIIFINPPLVS